MRSAVLVASAISLLAVASRAVAFQVDLVPGSRRSHDLHGTLGITGSDGLVHVIVTNVNDATGTALDETLFLELRVRDNGRRRRITIPVTVHAGGGDVSQSLGLSVGEELIVTNVRLRDPNHRVLAEIGTITADPASVPTPPAQCPAALTSCQSDLSDCHVQLDDCLSN